jgi:hypothetical protein
LPIVAFSFREQTESDPPDRLEASAGLSELAAKGRHVHVDGPVGDDGVDADGLVDELVAAEDAAARGRQRG